MSYASLVMSDTPSVYYRFDETNGITATDSSGHGIDGTYQSGVTLGTTGAITADADTAVSLTTNSEVFEASSASLPAVSSDRTVEAWVRSPQTGQDFTIAGYNGIDFYYYRYSNWLCVTGASTCFTPGFTLDDGNWHYVAYTWDSAAQAVTIYADGVALGTATNSALTDDGAANDPLYASIQGSLDELAVYPTALSPAQIAAHWTRGQSASTQCAPAPTSPYAVTIKADNPTAYYRLGETSGARVAFDASGHCLNGSRLVGAPAVDGAILGDPDTALSSTIPPADWGRRDFASTESSFEASSASLPSGSASRTVEAWVRSPHTGEDFVVAGYNGLNLYYTNYGNALAVGTGAFDAPFAGFGLPFNLDDGNWHYVAYTWDSATKTIAIYADGIEVGSTTLQDQVLSDDGPTSQPLHASLNGSLDEVAVYSTALSAARIAAHWQASGHAPPPAAGCSPNQGPCGGPRSGYEMAGGCPCGLPNYSDQGQSGDPVDTASGNFYETQTDVSIPGRGPALTLSRTYNAIEAAQNGAFGYGWSTPYGTNLRINPISGTVTVHQENGSELIFTQQPDGSYAPIAPRINATLTKNADGTYTYLRAHDTTMTFDGAGKLLQVTDRNGVSTTLSYDGSGHLATVTDAAGRSLTFTWTGGHVSQVTDPAGRTVSYGYDNSGNLTRVTAVDGAVTAFGYDASHHLTTILDPQQQGAATPHPLTNTYDAQGRVTAQTDQLGRTTTFTYLNGATLVTDPAGHRHLDVYWYGERVEVVDGYGTAQAVTTHYAYDPVTLGVTASYIQAPNDPNNHATTATYDADGQPITTTDGLGRTTTYTYDGNDDLLSKTVPNPSTVGPSRITTTYTYDAHGNLTSVTTPLYTSAAAFTNQTVTYHHDDPAHPGDVTSITDPLGRTTTLAYDTYGNLLSTTTPEGRTTTFTYDVLGNQLTAVAPKGNVAGANPAQFTTTKAYDVAGRVISTTVANGALPATTLHAYDRDGRLLTVTDPLGHVTTYTYDLAGQQTAVTRPDGTRLQTTYFPDGAVQSQIDGAGHATTYAEDALGRTVAMTDPLGRTTTYTYDGAGNVLTTRDPQGQTTTSAYNNADQLISTTYSDGKTPKVTYAYNVAGLRAAMADGTGTSTWYYDSAGRLVAQATPNGVVSYRYDLANHLTRITYPGSKAVVRTYGKDGELAAVTDWLGKTTTFGYDQNGANIRLSSPNGITSTVIYDNAGQVRAIGFSRGTTGLASLSYSRDAAGNVTSETPAGLGTAQAYSYNALNQLASDGTGSFGYDAADNLTKTLDGSTLAYDAANEAVSRTTPASQVTTYTYDRRGNRTSAAGASSATYTYDQANRLTGYTSGATMASYTYNGDGLRQSKTVGATTAKFVYDTAEGLPLILSDGTYSYVYGPSSTPIEQIGITGTVTYLHADQLGSVRLLTNSSGAVAGTASYDPYGKASASGATSAFGFAGQYTDAESGLIWMRARYYDPATGQFLTRDPLVSQTRSRYSYTGDNPVNARDPSGLVCALIVGGDCGPIHYTVDIGAVVGAGVHGGVTGNVDGTGLLEYGTGYGFNIGTSASVGSGTVYPGHYSSWTFCLFICGTHSDGKSWTQGWDVGLGARVAFQRSHDTVTEWDITDPSDTFFLTGFTTCSTAPSSSNSGSDGASTDVMPS